MPKTTTLEETVEILNLALGVEPVVLNFVKGILAGAQGKTGDQFLAEADSIWASVAATAQAELGQ